MLYIPFLKCTCYLAQFFSSDFSKLLALKKLNFTQLDKINNTTLRICTSDSSILYKYFDKIETDQTFTLAYTQTQENINHFILLNNYTNIIFNNYLLDWPIINKIFGYEDTIFESAGSLQSVYILDRNINDDLNGRVEFLVENKESCSGNTNSDFNNGISKNTNSDINNGVSAIVAGNINFNNGVSKNTNSDINNGVSAIVAGNNFGFARNTKIKLLNAVDCNGTISLSKLIKTLDLIKPDSKKITLLLLNIIGLKSEILDTYLQSLYLKNILIVAPAGNYLDDSCRYSPASFINGITVGSVDKYGNKDKTNNGSCISVYTINTALNLVGTGVSAALVMGILVLYLDQFPNANIEQIRKYLLKRTKESNGIYLVKYPKNDYLVYEDFKIWVFIFCIVLVVLIYFLMRKKREVKEICLESSSSI